MHPRLRRLWSGIFLALMLLAAMPGCGVRQLAQGEIQPPKVNVSRPQNLSAHGQGLAPGRHPAPGQPQPQAVNLLGYNYQLWIEGKSVAQGTSQQAVNLPPMGRR